MKRKAYLEPEAEILLFDINDVYMLEYRSDDSWIDGSNPDYGGDINDNFDD